eukprot:6204430-Pleurochrysis_carterae.AAC.1
MPTAQSHSALLLSSARSDEWRVASRAWRVSLCLPRASPLSLPAESPSVFRIQNVFARACCAQDLTGPSLESDTRTLRMSLQASAAPPTPFPFPAAAAAAASPNTLTRTQPGLF